MFDAGLMQHHNYFGASVGCLPLTPLPLNTCFQYSGMTSRANSKPCGRDNPRASNHHQQHHQQQQQNPLLRRTRSPQRQRQEAFLRKVREGQDNKRWESRSDQILRDDFLNRQKQWQNELLRSAPDLSPDQAGIDPEDVQASSKSVDDPDVDVDAILSQAEQDLQALVSSMEEMKDLESGQDRPAEYEEDTDEAEMDMLLLEMVSKGSQGDSNPVRNTSNGDEDVEMS